MISKGEETNRISKRMNDKDNTYFFFFTSFQANNKNSSERTRKKIPFAFLIFILFDGLFPIFTQIFHLE